MSMARNIPGQSIAERLFGRVGRRAQVGPKPGFYHRLGLEDPLAVDPSLAEDAGKEMFSFLKASAYYEDVARSRGRRRMLSRIERAPRQRLGSRLEVVGPRALTVRPSLLAGLSGLREAPLLAASRAREEEVEPAVAERPARRPSVAAEHGRRPRRALRPMEQVVARAPVAEGPVARVLEQLLREERGADREVLRQVSSRVRGVGAGAQLAMARRAIRELRGVSRVVAREELSRVEDEVAASPVAVARDRMSADPGRRSRGLRRVLGSSPAILAVEAPVEPVAPPRIPRRRPVTAPAEQQAVRAVPRQAAPVARAVRDVRSQQTSGRAGPGSEAGAHGATIAPRQNARMRRPTEWVAALTVAEDRLAAPDAAATYGLAAAGFDTPRSHGMDRLVARGTAGDVPLDGGPVLSRAATAWMDLGGQPRAMRAAAPAAVLSRVDTTSAAEEQAASAAPDRRAPPRPVPLPRGRAGRRPTAALPRVPQVPPSARALARAPRGSVAAPVARAPLTRSPVGRTAAQRAASRASGSAEGRRVALSASPALATDAGLARSARGHRAPILSVVASSASPMEGASEPTELALARLESSEALTGFAGRARGVAYVARDEAGRLVRNADLSATRLSDRSPQESVEGATASGGRPTVRALRRTLDAAGAPLFSSSPVRHLRSQTRLVHVAGAETDAAAPQASVPTGGGLGRGAAAPRISRRRPVSAPVRRAAARGELSAGADDRGVSRLATGPTRYVRAAGGVAGAGEVGPEAAAGRAARVGPTVRAATRGERTVRRTASGTLLTPAPSGYVQADPARATALVAGQGRLADARGGTQKARPLRAAAASALRGPVSGAPRIPAEASDRRERGAGPVVRAAQRLSAGSAPELGHEARTEGGELGSRIALARVPTAYLALDTAPEPAEESGSAGARSGDRAPSLPSDRPLHRAAGRAERLARVDARGRSLVMAAPTEYVGRSLVADRNEGRLPTRRRPARALRPADGGAPERILAAGHRRERGGELSSARAALRAELARSRARAPGGRWLAGPRRAAIPLEDSAAVGFTPGATTLAAARGSVDADRSAVPSAVPRRELRYLVGTSEANEVEAPQGSSRSRPSGMRRELARRAPLIRRPEAVGSAAESPREPQLRASGVGTFDRQVLSEVLRQVGAVVRAADRAEQSAATVSAARRTLGEDPARIRTVRARLVDDAGRMRRPSAADARRGAGPAGPVRTATPYRAGTTLVLPIQAEPPQAAPPQAAPPQAEWAEGRGAVASAGGATARGPGSRLLGRVLEPGVGGSRAVSSAVSRGEADDAAGPVGLRGVGFGEPTLLAAENAPRLDPESGRIVAPASGQRTFGRTARWLASPEVGSGRRGARPAWRRASGRGFGASAAADAEPSRERRGELGTLLSGDAPPATLLSGDAPPHEPADLRPRASGWGAPGWARRAVGGDAAESAERRMGFGAGLGERTAARTGGGLLTALARASRPEDVVQVILERSEGIRSLTRDLPSPAAHLIERIASTAHDAGRAAEPSQPGSAWQAARGTTVPARSTRSVRRDVLHPVRTFTTPSTSGSPARSGEGVGASNVMKLANKLMKLIHLAEVERKVQEAQKHVRMAENTADARHEAGAGQSGAESGTAQNMNIKALQQEVLEGVLRELELIQQRREDPDGRSIWW